jgi:Mg2+-importing ATPase
VAWAPEPLAGVAADPPAAGPRERGAPPDYVAGYAAAPPLQVLRRLAATPHGLAEDEAEDRLARLGENAIPLAAVPRWPSRILAAVSNPFVVVLAGLAAVSAVTGDLDGAALIAAMALISCVLRARQEHRSDRTAAALRAMVATTATAVRRPAGGAPGVARELPVDQLVPGDIVQLLAGDLVPADLRLLRSADLAVSQAAFTGESLPVAKRAAWVVTGDPAPAPGDASVFESPLMCLMGTSVVSGSGTAVVVATGSSTYLGSVGRQVSPRAAETSFDRGARSVSWLLVGFMLVCVPVVLAVSTALRDQPLEAFLFAIAVAVSLTPEVLPVVITTALAHGAQVMARRAAIVRRLPAVHNLGAMDVLCTDKTGTLTEGLVSVDCVVDSAGHPDPEVLRWACANSHWSAQAGSPVIADPLDEALLAHAAGLGVRAARG